MITNPVIMRYCFWVKPLVVAWFMVDLPELGLGEAPKRMRRSGLSHDMPILIVVIAPHLPHHRVFGEGVEGTALLGPLHGAVIATNDGQVAGGLLRRPGCDRWPIAGAGSVASRLTRGI